MRSALTQLAVPILIIFFSPNFTSSRNDRFDASGVAMSSLYGELWRVSIRVSEVVMAYKISNKSYMVASILLHILNAY